MAEMKENASSRKMKIRYRGRVSQVGIYLGKLLRMFIYQSDWKVLPMAALIAGLVGLVIRNKLFLTMEGSLMGAFSLVCVCIWNGCFNSIQVICRERDVIKREHRSGMHISSYIFSHMAYQALLCALQTGVTLYILFLVGVQYPEKGIFFRWFLIDFGISMFLISYASDMLSLWISTLAKNTTTAMTIMPFILIFQLVFSGGMLTLPDWTQPIRSFTISSPGLNVIAAQSDINNQPFTTISGMVDNMRDQEIEVRGTIGEAADFLQNEENPTIRKIRSEPIAEGVTAGAVIDLAAGTEELQKYRDQDYEYTFTVGDLLDLAGQEKVKTFLEESATRTRYEDAYEYTRENVRHYWIRLTLFALAFALLAMVTLEFIDKDKR